MSATSLSEGLAAVRRVEEVSGPAGEHPVVAESVCSATERGLALSGGQRQRLALARALLRRSDVLLLDEATSQLDSRSEQRLLRTLVDTAHARTVIAVTHRLAIAERAEQVILLDDGHVRAVGSHRQLLATDSLYRALASTGRRGA